MKQLPGMGYTLCDYRYFSRVPQNYHLEYDGHYYSVLYTYLGEPAILKATIDRPLPPRYRNDPWDLSHRSL